MLAPSRSGSDCMIPGLTSTYSREGHALGGYPGVPASECLRGLFYGLPMPMKAVSAVILTDGLRPGEVAAAGMMLGLILLVLGITGWIGRLARMIPQPSSLEQTKFHSPLSWCRIRVEPAHQIDQRRTSASLGNFSPRWGALQHLRGIEHRFGFTIRQAER